MQFVVCNVAASPLPRNFEIKFALRRIGILAGFAVCILTFAAPDAQAQTSCEAGKRAFASVDGNGFPVTVCISNNIADLGDACRAAKWNAPIFGADFLACNIIVSLAYHPEEGRAGKSAACQITPTPVLFKSCTDVFGDPPQFPIEPSGNGFNDLIYVANCSKGGTIPGAIPPGINMNGETECTCGGPGGYVGTWPDCACPSESIPINNVCTCPDEQVLQDGACVACRGGQIPQNGVCACSADSVSYGEVCIPKLGDFGLSDELLCGAFGGTVRMATGGKEVCSGMDANDTFCIMDSAVGFPCRGLFKHLRSCNLQFNRKALNPFFCGENCGVQKAVGSECR